MFIYLNERDGKCKKKYVDIKSILYTKITKYDKIRKKENEKVICRKRKYDCLFGIFIFDEIYIYCISIFTLLNHFRFYSQFMK